MKRTTIALALGPLALSVILTTLAQQPGVENRPPNGAGQKPAFAGQTRAPEHKLNVAYDVVTSERRSRGPVGSGLPARRSDAGD